MNIGNISFDGFLTCLHIQTLSSKNLCVGKYIALQENLTSPSLRQLYEAMVYKLFRTCSTVLKTESGKNIAPPIYAHVEHAYQLDKHDDDITAIEALNAWS